jgi:quinol-cytochrome oxidoreductase complex cytochrome b subunit
MAMFQALRLVPGGALFGIENEALVILGFGAIGALGFMIPFLDRTVARTGRSPMFTLLGVVALAFLVGMTAWGYHAWWPAAVAFVVAGAGWLSGRAMVPKRHDTA